MTLKDILISGKLTISEGGGGGSDCETGEITITESVTELTIPVHGLYSHFLIIAWTKWADMIRPTFGAGNVAFMLGEASWYSVMIRANGQSVNGYDRTPGWRGDKIQFNADSIFIKAFGNGDISQFPEGVVYRWVAW